MSQIDVQIYFSDYFDVSPEELEQYGAFNISLVNDLPLFIDPFLLFNSTNPEYQKQHDKIIRYLRFLKQKALQIEVNNGLLKSWYMFQEVKQNWLGFSQVGNLGSGLGLDFARALHANLYSIFADFGQEQVTQGSHLEKLCLIADGVGRDNISDFATNLIKGFLLEYTQRFAQQHLKSSQRKNFLVERVRFNYSTESWERASYELPVHLGEYVLLTPRDILTKDDTWINKSDMVENFDQIAEALPDEQLRAQLNNYFVKSLSGNPTKRERNVAAAKTLRNFPQVVDYYIRSQEERSEEASAISSEKVHEIETMFIHQVKEFVTLLNTITQFYSPDFTNTLEQARQRVNYLKQVIENNDGYRIFYLEGRPLKREQDMHILYLLTWRASPADVNREVNNGRGPVDFKISQGSRDKSLVEFKLASNSQLRRNLERQVEIYEKANSTTQSIKVIVFFSAQEEEKVRGILKELHLANHPDIYLIDARNENKPSASTA